MKTILIASGDFFSTYGGGQVYVKNIVDEMIHRGDSVAVLSFVACGKDGSMGVENKLYNGAKLVEVSEDINSNQLSDIIKIINPDVIHAHSHKADICKIGAELNIPVVVTAHHGGILCPAGTYMNYKDEICSREVSHQNCLRCCLHGIRSGRYWYPLMMYLPKSTYQKLGKFLKTKTFIPFVTPIGQTAYNISCKQREWKTIADLSSKMIAPCKSIAQAMVKNGMDSKKITIVPHGIPIPKFIHTGGDNNENDIVKLFFLGRISRIKGVHILLEAFSRYNNQSVELHIVGGAVNKAEQRYMNMLQRKYCNDNRIVWHGKIIPEKIFETISSYDIMVHPAIFLEVFGLNISESLAMGKPVLATRCGGAEMQIEDGVNGWLIEPNNVDALLIGINKAVKDYSTLYNINGRVVPIADHCEALNKLYSEV